MCVCVRAFVCVFVRAYMRACVCEREREKERKKGLRVEKGKKERWEVGDSYCGQMLGEYCTSYSPTSVLGDYECTGNPTNTVEVVGRSQHAKKDGQNLATDKHT